MNNTTTEMGQALRELLQREPSMELFDDSEERPRPRTLTELYARIHTCTKCPLGHTRTKFVFGVGPDDADLLLIGEAPGRDEDMQGEPFVGRAGKLLDKMLAAIDLSRKDVYIANILKCRPPANRDPLPDEAATCLPYLAEQIRLLQPKVICALGRIAAQILLETKSPLSKLRGRFYEFGTAKLMATYHPAALLRNPNFKRDAWEDLKVLRRAYDELRGETSKF